MKKYLLLVAILLSLSSCTKKESAETSSDSIERKLPQDVVAFASFDYDSDAYNRYKQSKDFSRMLKIKETLFSVFDQFYSEEFVKNICSDKVIDCDKQEVKENLKKLPREIYDQFSDLIDKSNLSGLNAQGKTTLFINGGGDVNAGFIATSNGKTDYTNTLKLFKDKVTWFNSWVQQLPQRLDMNMTESDTKSLQDTISKIKLTDTTVANVNDISAVTFDTNEPDLSPKFMATKDKLAFLLKDTMADNIFNSDKALTSDVTSSEMYQRLFSHLNNNDTFGRFYIDFVGVVNTINNGGKVLDKNLLNELNSISSKDNSFPTIQEIKDNLPVLGAALTWRAPSSDATISDFIIAVNKDVKDEDAKKFFSPITPKGSTKILSKLSDSTVLLLGIDGALINRLKEVAEFFDKETVTLLGERGKLLDSINSFNVAVRKGTAMPELLFAFETSSTNNIKNELMDITKQFGLSWQKKEVNGKEVDYTFTPIALVYLLEEDGTVYLVTSETALNDVMTGSSSFMDSLPKDAKEILTSNPPLFTLYKNNEGVRAIGEQFLPGSAFANIDNKALDSFYIGKDLLTVSYDGEFIRVPTASF